MTDARHHTGRKKDETTEHTKTTLGWAFLSLKEYDREKAGVANESLHLT
jgi:hypothetical protein